MLSSSEIFVRSLYIHWTSLPLLITNQTENILTPYLDALPQEIKKELKICSITVIVLELHIVGVRAYAPLWH